MANYANKYFEEYVEEDSLKEATLCQNTVPDNLIISRISHKILKTFWQSFSEKLLMWLVLRENYGIFWKDQKGQKMLSKYL